MAGVLYEIRGSAAWIVLDRPEKRNALSLDMITELEAALDRADGDDAVRVVVLTGRGSAFCAGADLEAGQNLATEERSPFARLLPRFQSLPKPVIAAVNGPAFGGGLGLIAASDIVVASSGAVFSFSEVRVGLVPAMISVVALPKIGLHHARRLFLTGRRFSAEEAVQCGLVHRVVPGDELEAAVDEEVAEIAKGGPVAVAETKRILREIPRLGEEEALDYAFGVFVERVRSEEAREGMAAFAEKRPPRWRSTRITRRLESGTDEKRNP